MVMIMVLDRALIHHPDTMRTGRADMEATHHLAIQRTLQVTEVVPAILPVMEVMEDTRHQATELRQDTMRTGTRKAGKKATTDMAWAVTRTKAAMERALPLCSPDFVPALAHRCH